MVSSNASVSLVARHNAFLNGRWLGTHDLGAVEDASEVALAGDGSYIDCGLGQGGAMLDHIIFSVSDLDASKAFYEKALAPLGYTIVFNFPGGCGFGVLEKPDFFIRQGESVTPRIHVAFSSRDHASVDQVYAAALAAGGTDNGAPGLREDYHPNYYGAFFLDPDGNNIEAVCHRPQ